MTSAPRFSVCEFTTMPASFEEDLAACRSGGADGIGICEAKLPAGDDAGLLEKLRDSGLQASVCLPAGLSIGSSTGRITGTATTAGTRTVVVTVSDGIANASTSFTFTVTADTTAPTTPGTPTAVAQNGKPNLTWTASTDNVGVTGYIIYRATSALSGGSEVGRSTTTSFRDANAQRRKTYYYSIVAYDAAGNLSARSGVKMYTVR